MTCHPGRTCERARCSAGTSSRFVRDYSDLTPFRSAARGGVACKSTRFATTHGIVKFAAVSHDMYVRVVRQ